ncbi:MAG: peptidase dimerization domain-containing protein [Acidothermaceae bacterium]
MTQAVDAVLSALDSQREELAELVLHLANTYAPVGGEIAAAREVDEWYRANSIESNVIELVEGRANTVGRIRGDGSGKTLIFNAHLDTEASGPDFDNLMGVPDPNIVGARREGDRIFGHTALNDRHAHPLFMFAARAVRDAGVKLGGDLVLTSVAGETGQAPVDEYKGLRYDGKGLGSTYLVEHGVRGDYALVSETTDFALNWHGTGANYYKVTIRGKNMYTPRLDRGDTWTASPNSILKASYVVQAIEDWAAKYTVDHTGMTPCGEVRPQAQVGAIRGGIPWRPNRSSPYTALYVDVRTLPGENPDRITKSLRDAIDAVGVDAQLDLIMSKSGALGKGIEPLAEAITTGHKLVRGDDPPRYAEPAVVGMWRDINVFNKAGIPSITYGPSRGSAGVQGRGFLEVDDLIDAAKVYALVILQVCNGLKVG